MLHLGHVPHLLLLAGAEVRLELGCEKGGAEALGGVVGLQDGRPAIHALGRRHWVLAALRLLVSLNRVMSLSVLVVAVAQIVEVLVRVFRRLIV